LLIKIKIWDFFSLKNENLDAISSTNFLSLFPSIDHCNGTNIGIDLFMSSQRDAYGPLVTQDDANNTTKLLHFLATSAHLGNGTSHHTLLKDLALLVSAGFNFDYRYILQDQPHGYSFQSSITNNQNKSKDGESKLNNHTNNHNHNHNSVFSTANIIILIFNNTVFRFTTPLQFSPDFQRSLIPLFSAPLNLNQGTFANPPHQSLFFPTPRDITTFITHSFARTKIQEQKLSQIVSFLTILHNMNHAVVDTKTFSVLQTEYQLNNELQGEKQPDSTVSEPDSVLISYDQLTSLMHCSLLHTIWSYAMNYDDIPSSSLTNMQNRNDKVGKTHPKTPNSASLLLPSYPGDKLWTLLGFQGNTPHTDFRSSALVALHLVLYISIQHKEFFKSLIFLHEGFNVAPYIYGLGWAFEDDDRFSGLNIPVVTQEQRKDEPKCPDSPGQSKKDSSKTIKDPYIHLSHGMKPLPLHYDSSSQQDDYQSGHIHVDVESMNPKNSKSAHITHKSRAQSFPSTRLYPIIAVMNNIIALVMQFLPSQSTFISTLETNLSPNSTFSSFHQFEQQRAQNSATASQPPSAARSKPQTAAFPLKKEFLDFSNPVYYQELIQNGKYSLIWDTLLPNNPNQKVQSPPTTTETKPTQKFPSWSYSGLHPTMTPFLFPTHSTEILNNLSINELNIYHQNTLKNNTFYYYPKIISSPLLRLFLNTSLAEDIPIHILFFELCTNLVSLIDVLAIHMKASYLDFPFLLTTLNNRLSSILNRDLCSFSQLLQLLWNDEDWLLLTYGQLKQCDRIQNESSANQQTCPKCGNNTTCIYRCSLYDYCYVYNPINTTCAVIPTPPYLARNAKNMSKQ